MIKIRCNVCEGAEANVFCCADEAALCWGCDQTVHAANKLASKHQRVPLSSSTSQMPKCDICQETVCYFFCLEDRAILCRKCDVTMHAANSLVSAHQRFLLTGIKVGLEATETSRWVSSSTGLQSQSIEKHCESESQSLTKKTSLATPAGVSTQGSLTGDFPSSMQPSNGGSSTASMSLWQLDEYLDLGDCNPNYNLMGNSSSKADNGKLGGESDCSPVLRAADAEFEGDEYLGQVPDTFLTVPEIHSPPTASGLYWPKNYQDLSYPGVFVPDINSSPLQTFNHQHSNIYSFKRRRQF